ncbi:hypothetical protein FQR65_LT18391 [Abscondita terminalis]|nr:hypothetical protein FQR65_LT18391 [Abscondita terminalis]
MAFVIVEFSKESGGGVSIVHTSWLTPRKKELLWPPFKQQSAFDKAVQKGAKPDESWILYPITRCFYETAFTVVLVDDYLKSREKLKASQDQSDIQSGVDEDNQPILKKRRIHTPQRLLSFSEEDDEEEGLCLKNTGLPRPQKFKSLDRCIDRCTNGSQGHDYNIQRCLTPIIPHNSSPTSTASSTHVSNHSQDLDLKKKICTTLLFLKEQNGQIIKLLENLQKPQKPIYNFEIPEDFPVTLPLKNIDDVHKLENYLTLSTENLSRLVSHLSTLGGRDVASKTNSILSRLMSNDLSTQYSFLGTRNGKKAFSKLMLKTLVNREYCAVQATSSCTEEEVNSKIKDWLKHAPSV